MNQTTDKWALHAYADGELEGHEKADVERRLETDADARKLVDAISREKQALHAAFDDVLDEPVPVALLVSTRPRHISRVAPWAAVAASLAMLVLGAAGGWFAAEQTGTTQMASLSQRAILAHQVYAVDQRHPVEVKANESEHLQAWLSKRIGSQIQIPDLEAEGYTFLGGRLLAAEDRPAGQLMYEDAEKHRIAVYLTRNDKHNETSMIVAEKQGVFACFWQDENLGMAVTGEMPREKMLALAQIIYDQLEKG